MRRATFVIHNCDLATTLRQMVVVSPPPPPRPRRTSVLLFPKGGGGREGGAHHFDKIERGLKASFSTSSSCSSLSPYLILLPPSLFSSPPLPGGGLEVKIMSKKRVIQ